MPRRVQGRRGWSATVRPHGWARRRTGIRMIVAAATLCLAAPALARLADTPAISSATADGWRTYRSERGHFSVQHPAGWRAGERIDTRGDLVTTLAPPRGEGIAVIVRSSAHEDASDLGNVRCHPVILDGRAARTCLDTVSSSLFTTVVAGGKTYLIAGSRRQGERTYDRVLASFRILP
jgi:hypothetical protein